MNQSPRSVPGSPGQKPRLHFPRRGSAINSPPDSGDSEQETSSSLPKRSFFAQLGSRKKSLDKIEVSDRKLDPNESKNVPDLGGHSLFRKGKEKRHSSSNGPRSPGKKSSQELRLDTQSNRSSQWKPSFEDILSDHRLVSLFYSHLCQSHCEEHLVAYLLFEDFKAAPSQKVGDLIAERIVKAHFAEDAIHPVNVEAKARFALCERYKECSKDIPKDFFEEVIYEVHKLLMQDCYGRFVVQEIPKYWQVVDFPKTKQVKTLPSASQIRADINATEKWVSAKAMMPDIILVEKKDQCRGTINLKNCQVSRVMEMLIAVKKYIDWCPDIDEAEDTEVDFGPCLSVKKVKIFEECEVALAVFRLSASFYESIVGWESCAKSDFQISGGFTVDLLPSCKDTQVSLLLKVGKKGKAVKFVQNVLLGLLLAIGGQCESRESELDELTPFGEFDFLKKI